MRTVDWNRSVFVMITPDAVERQLARPILERIVQNGFAPFRYRLVWAGSEQLDAIYQVNIAEVWDTYRYRLVDQLFHFGPAIVLLVEDQQRGDQPHERLQQLKGSSHPYKASRGTIRRDFRGINSILGLIHTSDSGADAERESAIFFQPAQRADQEPAGTGDQPDIWQLCDLLALRRPPERREFDDVLAGLRAKIVVALWDELLPGGHGLLAEWRARGVAALARSGAGRELTEYLRSGPEHPLADVLQCEFQPDSPRVDLDSAWRRLAGWGVETDAWERLVLTTSIYFKPCHADDFAAPADAR